MHFQVKLALFRAIEKMPCGDAMYYFLQRHITKTLSLDKATFIESYDSKVREHLPLLAKYGASPLEKSVYYEFGAGWDLISVIGFSLNGMQKCICVDINRLLHVQVIRETIEHYTEYADELGTRPPQTFDGTLTNENMESYLYNRFNIEYRAPYDARQTDLQNDSIDYIVSNVTLEHVQKDDVRLIMEDCYRVLKPGGIGLIVVDHSDHWSHADPSITPYNYLQYSEAAWKKYNPDIHYQNRLRSSDYRKIFTDCGFLVLEERLVQGDEKDRAALHSMQIADCFSGYSEADLLTTCSTFVLAKGSH